MQSELAKVVQRALLFENIVSFVHTTLRTLTQYNCKFVTNTIYKVTYEYFDHGTLYNNIDILLKT